MSLEPVGWAAALALSTSFVVYEGARKADLEEATPIAAKPLYKMLGTSTTKVQLVDVRPDPGEHYEDDHVPGSIPFPGCDAAGLDAAVKPFVVRSVPTIVISQDGDPKVFATCAAFFSAARNLEGGFDAWEEAGLPTVGDVYVPPKPSAGGGCL